MNEKDRAAWLVGISECDTKLRQMMINSDTKGKGRRVSELSEASTMEIGSTTSEQASSSASTSVSSNLNATTVLDTLEAQKTKRYFDKRGGVPYPISICNKVCGSVNQFVEKPGILMCSSKGCGETFDNQDDLLDHLNRDHAVVKLYPCLQCPMIFREVLELEDHVNKAHDAKFSDLHYCLQKKNLSLCVLTEEDAVKKIEEGKRETEAAKNTEIAIRSKENILSQVSRANSSELTMGTPAKKKKRI